MAATSCECPRPLTIQDDDLGPRCFRCGKSLFPRRWAILRRLREAGYVNLPRA